MNTFVEFRDTLSSRKLDFDTQTDHKAYEELLEDVATFYNLNQMIMILHQKKVILML